MLFWLLNKLANKLPMKVLAISADLYLRHEFPGQWLANFICRLKLRPLTVRSSQVPNQRKKRKVQKDLKNLNETWSKPQKEP